MDGLKSRRERIEKTINEDEDSKTEIAQSEQQKENRLTGPGQWFSCLECLPVQQNVVGSIPSQGTPLGCRFHTQMRVPGRKPIDVSPSYRFFFIYLSIYLSIYHLSISPFTSKINEKNLQVKIKKRKQTKKINLKDVN